MRPALLCTVKAVCSLSNGQWQRAAVSGGTDAGAVEGKSRQPSDMGGGRVQDRG